VNYIGASPVDTIRGYLVSGRGAVGAFESGETWNGATGIISSNAAADLAHVGIGYAENSAIPAGSYSTFMGQTVGASTILIRYTRIGDANLDGIVDGNDAGTLGGSFNAAGFGQWYYGDFDYDGTVTGDDAGAQSGLFNPSALPL